MVTNCLTADRISTCTIFALLLFSASTCVTTPVQAQDDDKNAGENPPNILFIVADDLGVEGVQAYGGQSYNTPNIDRLARQGMRFTRAFSNALCTPSRGELLTGRYPFRNGMDSNIYDPEKHSKFLAPGTQPSFARQLQKAGYTTAIAGKWQLSFLNRRDTPHELGFDTYQLWQIFFRTWWNTSTNSSAV